MFGRMYVHPFVDSVLDADADADADLVTLLESAQGRRSPAAGTNEETRGNHQDEKMWWHSSLLVLSS